MCKKFQNSDKSFVFFILLISVWHIVCIFSFPGTDEAFYPTAAFRLIGGDSLVSDEWHLTQFSSLFSYLPVLIWLKLKGSAEGMIIFLRAVYLLIHTSCSVVLYRSLRKFGFAASIASALFFMAIPYSIASISYISVYSVCSVFFSLLIFRISESPRKIYYIGAGFLYGCCCVCNPLLCCVFILYCLFAVLIYFARKTNKKSPKKTGSKAFFVSENVFGLYFCAKSVLMFFLGICIIAAVAVVFFFFTGGTLSGITENIAMMLKYTEYSDGLINRIIMIYNAFSSLSFNMPLLLPILFIALLIDKQRRKPKRRVMYLFFTFLLCCLFSVRMVSAVYLYGVYYNSQILAVLLPVVLFSTVCYILTERKNKSVFYYMYFPGFVMAIVQFCISRTIFTTLGWSVIPCVVAGIIFISDLFTELKADVVLLHGKTNGKKDVTGRIGLILFPLFFCLQVCIYVFLSFACHYEQYIPLDLSEDGISFISEGPAAGTVLPGDLYEDYTKTIRDLNKVIELSKNDDAVLLLTNEPWTYLYMNRQWATYTAWYQFISVDALAEYYNINQAKSPDYVYVSNEYYSLDLENKLNQVLDCHNIYLENGVLFIANG